MRSSFFYIAVAASCFFFPVRDSLAQPAGARLSLEEAVSRTLERNLDFKAFEHELHAQAGRLQQARARPNSEIGVLVENAFGSGERRDLDAAETTLSLGLVLEHGARERRIDVARAGSSLLEVQAQVQRLDMAAETARRFVAVLSTQELRDVSQRATRFAEETAAAVRARVDAAKAPQAEDARAQAQLARVRLEEEHAEHQLASMRQRLAAMWGSTQADFSEAGGDILTLPPLVPFESWRAQLQGNADIARLVSEQRVRETEQRLAEMRRRPPWHFTAGIRRFEVDDDHAFIVGLTVPIGSRKAAQGAIDEARSETARVQAQAAALRVRLDAELFSIYQELRHAYAEVATLRAEVLPRLETAVEQSRYAYERGRYGYVEWVAAQRELVDLRRALVDASTDAHRQRIELERLTGTALDPLTR